MWTTVARFATSKVISKFRQSRQGSRPKMPSGVRKWVLAGAASAIAGFLVVVILMSAVFAMATAATAPLRAASDVVSKIPLVGEPLSNAVGGGDDSPSEEELEDIRAEAEEAGLSGDAEMSCLFELPDATVTATPLYIRAETDEQRQQREEQARKYGLAENAELVSYDPPLAEPGAQLSVNGRATTLAKDIAATVPYETHAAVARAYLVTSLAGGTTGFEQFSAVASKALDGAGEAAVTPDLAAGVAAAFFPAGTDLSPFYKLADSLVFTLHQQGGLGGDIDFTTDSYRRCTGD